MNNPQEKEFEGLLRRYGALIRKVCYMYAQTGEEYRDLYQEALLHIWRGFDTFRGESAQSTWIYRVTLNSCVSFIRKESKNRANISLEEAYGLQSRESDRAALLKELHSLVNRLGPVDKAIVLLWLDDYPYDTIAEVMGMSRNSIATRLHRIKQKLITLSNS